MKQLTIPFTSEIKSILAKKVGEENADYLYYFYLSTIKAHQKKACAEKIAEIIQQKMNDC